MSKGYSFYFHFNKIASRAAGKPKISIHYKNQCLIVDNLQISVNTNGRVRRNQPFFVIAGKAKDIQIKDGVAFIN